MADANVPALATTKRKFYKLLDGLNSSTSLKTNKSNSTATLDEPTSKRSRLSVDSSRPTRPTSVRVIGSHVVARTSDGTVLKAAATPGKTPNYQPYSQEAFLARLKTFSDVKIWTYKPSEISEVEWTKRGWVCDAKQIDTVACRGGCEARVVVRLERGRERAKALERLDGDVEQDADGAEQEHEEEQWDGAPDEELVSRYSALIVDGHKEGCLWKSGGCKDDIYRIRMGDATLWQGALLDRYNSLLQVMPSLPDRLKLPDNNTEHTTNATGKASQELLTIDHVTSRLSAILTSPNATESEEQQPSVADMTTPNATATALALFGWTGSSPHNIHLATCDRCFQRIGLWLYTSDPSNKALPSAQSGIADDDILSFDLAGLHREYCPWVSAESQCGLGPFGGLAGWEIVLKLVETKIARDRSQRESLDPSNRAGEDGNHDYGQEYLEKSRGDLEREDKERESRLAKLKRVFTVKKSDKSENRKSWRSLGK